MPLKPENKTGGGKTIRTAVRDQHQDFQIQLNARLENLMISIYINEDELPNKDLSLPKMRKGIKSARYLHKLAF